MKTYDFGDNDIIKGNLRHYVCYGIIPNIDDFRAELDALIADREKLHCLKKRIELLGLEMLTEDIE